jgi:hypothetical protein
VIYKYCKLLQRARTPTEERERNLKNGERKNVSIKDTSFLCKVARSFVHCCGRSLDIMRHTHRSVRYSSVPDDLFLARIAES